MGPTVQSRLLGWLLNITANMAPCLREGSAQKSVDADTLK